MTVGGLVLFHGAGGDRDHQTFLALEDGLDIPVARCNFAYRDKGPGRRPPDRMPKLLERVNERAVEYAEEWDVDPKSLVFGGRSMGGRACSIAVAEGMPAAGLLLLSYPLHPTGKPEKLRVEHFGDLKLPVLLVQGDRDPFGTPAEFAAHLGAIKGKVTQLWLPKVGHGPKQHDPLIVGATSGWLACL